ncbi:STAS domain-containing protein [Humisphaera borealis]|uniref:STAS domain-containing protein n=1 Tax=Humisphaera borealis TaxID=2807512 RepID=A0A7M2X2I8_9BACT|nr:STAS domain-containing protein [Humisphaera borealis]QOV91261.1 STAS domain-containing protein [Humisphaera borealis]
MPKQQPMTVTTGPAPAGAKGETLIVTIAGDLGINALVGPAGQHSGIGEDTALDKALADRLSNPPALVVVDLTEVAYLASVGMGALLRLKKKVEDAGSRVHFVGTEGLTKLLKYSHLDKVMKLHPTLESALAGA